MGTPEEAAKPHADKLFADIVADITLWTNGMGVLGPLVKLTVLIQAFQNKGPTQHLPHVNGQMASLKRLEEMFPTLLEDVRVAIVAYYHKETRDLLRTYPNGLSII